MAKITFTIPSVLNKGEGEKKFELTVNSLLDSFAQISQYMGDDFKRRVLDDDGRPRPLINIYINGKNARFSGGMNASLNDGDNVYILPAVAGGEISAKELDRYSRQIMLEQIGYEGQLKLKSARICVVGVGGLGNPITSRLVAMGVGRLRIVDRDVIELSNLHRQTLFDESDVGKIKVEAAKEKLQKLNSGVEIEALAISVNDYTAPDVTEGCDVVIDALDSVNARYALNKACVAQNIPFVTGAAVGVFGQVFAVIPGQSACYCCVFPELDEDSMPTCSIEGVHPSILSVVGGIEVSEAVRIICGKKPALYNKILHIDVDAVDFTTTKISRVPQCPVCGTGKAPHTPKQELIIEELCGRNRGRRTFSITPTTKFEIDADMITELAKKMQFVVENQGELGLSVRNNELSVSFMKRGSAVIVGPRDQNDAVLLYKKLVRQKS